VLKAEHFNGHPLFEIVPKAQEDPTAEVAKVAKEE
jgi:hypothetical protein